MDEKMTKPTEEQIPPRAVHWQLLFAHIPYFETRPITPWRQAKPEGERIALSYPEYSDEMRRFISDFYSSEAADDDYMVTIERSGIRSHGSFADAIPTANKRLLRAMLTCYIRQERYHEGLLAKAAQSGALAALLKRLRSLAEGECAG